MDIPRFALTALGALLFSAACVISAVDPAKAAPAEILQLGAR